MTLVGKELTQFGDWPQIYKRMECTPFLESALTLKCQSELQRLIKFWKPFVHFQCMQGLTFHVIHILKLYEQTISRIFFNQFC